MKVSKGVLLSSRYGDVYRALEKYCLGKTFLDMGAGKGDVVKYAQEAGAINPRGVEYEDYATDIRGDLFEQDIDQYEVLFYYALGCNNEQDLYRWVSRKFKGIFLVNTYKARTTDLTLLGKPLETLGKVKVFKFNQP